jgi:Cu-processing system ATP-binding protein
MMQIQDISKRFGKLQVLKKVSTVIEKGRCVALIGHNGSGKSTLIKSMLGLVIPDSGSISIDQKNVQTNTLAKLPVGYMPQMGRYPQNMRIGEVFDLVKKIRPNSKALDHELYDAYSLSTMLDKKMGTLSGGTIQKVSASLAFLFQAEVLILDEPTAGLDPLSASILKQKIVQEKEKGKLVIISSHQLSELDQLADEVMLLQDGHLVFHQNKHSLLNASGSKTIEEAILHQLTPTA